MRFLVLIKDNGYVGSEFNGLQCNEIIFKQDVIWDEEPV